MADFLYNGVQFPEMPEVEGCPYKYAYYHKYNEYRYELVCSETPLRIYRTSPYGPHFYSTRTNVKGESYAYINGDWVKCNLDVIIFTGDTSSYYWSNYEILYEDDVVYRTKSPDPVPVLKKGKLQCSTLDLLIEPGSGGNAWVEKTWNGITGLWIGGIWTDGTRFYYSYNEEQYVLNGDTWEPKTWNGLTSFLGSEVWTDGTNVYCNHYAGLGKDDYYVLQGDTWVEKTWNNAVSLSGVAPIWTDGENIYYSVSAVLNNSHYVLDGDTWVKKDWGNTPIVFGEHIWSDGTNIYSSYMTKQYILVDGTWVEKSWSGLTDFDGEHVWTDGTDIYYSYAGKHYALDGDTWVEKTWNGSTNLDGAYVWTDGTNIYYSSQYVLTTSPPPEPHDPKTTLMGWLAGARIAGMRKWPTQSLS